MKVVYVVQRFGPEAVGGAEAAARQLATRLAARGADVSVFTTASTNAATWANDLPVGESTDGAVRVVRFPTTAGRDSGFEQLSARVFSTRDPPPELVDRWVNDQGPRVPALIDEIRARADEPDLWIFYTYLYYPTLMGLPPVAGRAVLHPALHDEPPARLPIVREVLRRAAGLFLQTPEEWELVLRFAGWPPAVTALIGLGVEAGDGDVEAFRRRVGLGSDPYLLSLGRVDEGKGTTALARMFAAFKARHPGPLKLVVAGPVAQAPAQDDVIVPGFLGDEERWGALAGATAFIHPSPAESFGIVLLEAWAKERPALVNAACAVTAGHARRSRGALAYRDYADFESALELILGDPAVAASLGAAGARYAAGYAWDSVMDRYESFLQRVIERPESGADQLR